MTRTVEDQVISILARHAVLEPEEVSPDLSLSELGLDSLGMVETIFALEENFDITIPFAAGESELARFGLNTVGDIVARVRDLSERRA